MRVLAYFTLFGSLFYLGNSQIHYVPAQVLIPTFNGTHIAANHTIYNVINQQQPLSFHNSTYFNGTTLDGHLIIGEIQRFDRLLFNQEYFKDSRWWTSREKIIEYPKDVPAGYNRHETIHCIKVFNKFYDGSSATAKILKGGVNYQYTKIQLQSKWGKGFRFLVQIYGQ